MFSLLARIGANATGFYTALKQTDSAAKAWAGKIKGSIGAQLASAFGGAAIVAGMKRSLDRAGRIADESAAVGLTAERYQELEFAASQSGASIEQVTTAIRQLAKAQSAVLTKGDTGAMAAFESLGVTVDDLRSKNAPALFDQIASKLDGAASNTALLTRAMELFGKSGASVLPMMFNGLAEASAQAHNLGVVLNDEVVDGLDQAGDQLDQLTNQFESGFAIITAAVVGFARKFTNVFEATFTGVGAAYDKLLELFSKGPQGNPLQTLKAFFTQTKAAFESGFEQAVKDQLQQEAELLAERQRKREALRAAQAEQPIEQIRKQEKEMQRARGMAERPNVNQLQRIGAQVGGTSPRTENILKDQLRVQRETLQAIKGGGEGYPA